MKKTITQVRVLFLFLVCLAGLHAANAQATTLKNGANQLTYKITSSADNTFGYDIYNQGVLVVHQPIVPGNQGKRGFVSHQKAVDAAIQFISDKNNPKIVPVSKSVDRVDSK